MAQEVLVRILVDSGKATQSVRQVKKSFDGLEKSISKVQKKTKDPKETTGIDNAILMETSRLASDASFGFTAMANNLGQLVNLFKISKDATGSYAASLGKLINFQSAALIGIQLLITFGDDLFNIFMKLFKGSDLLKDTFKDIKGEISNTAGSFETYVRILQDSNSSQESQRAALINLKKQFPDYIQDLKDAGLSTEDLKNKTNDIIKITNNYRKSLLKLAMARAAQKKIDELAAEGYQAEIDAVQELKEMNLTLDKARELSAKRDETRQRLSGKRGSGSRKEREKANTERIRQADEIIEKLDEENIRVQEGINQLMKYTQAELEFEGARTKGNKTREEKNKYDKIEIRDLREIIREIKHLGRIRKKFNEDTVALAISNIDNSKDALEQERIMMQERLKSERIQFGENLEANESYLQARDAINSFYAEKEKIRAEEQAELEKQLNFERLRFYADSLGSISDLLGKNTKAGKAAALAEITANTAIGFAQALTLAQKQAADGLAIAFPLFYASQIAAVLSAMSRAKSILNSGGGATGGGGIGGQRGGVNVEAPDFNVVGASQVSQLGRLVSSQQNKPLKAFVVGKEISSQQELDRNITNTAGI